MLFARKHVNRSNIEMLLFRKICALKKKIATSSRVLVKRKITIKVEDRSKKFAGITNKVDNKATHLNVLVNLVK